MASIRLEGVSKSYGKGRDRAVAEVDLEIGQGEFVVLLGPSGCGKTSTLRLIAGLESPTAGSISFDGIVVNDLPGSRRGVGMVFQNYALYPHMTVFENLAFGLRSRGVGKQETAVRVAEVLELLELSELARRRPRELSGGQRQRVALGRALVGRPSVFLMDEPLSNLDANLREQMRIELGRLHDRLGITTVYVTHDQGEAMTLADRVVVMEGGRIRQVGTPKAIYGAPSDTFVARFIGSPGMNILALPWRRDGEHVLCGESLRLPAEWLPMSGGEAGRVVVGIRPEQLRLAEVPGEVELACRVDVVEQLGSHQQVHLVVAGEQDGARLIARLPGDANIASGDLVKLGADAADLRFFDPDTGLALAEEAWSSGGAVSAGVGEMDRG